MTDAPPPSSALLDLVLRYGDAREKYAEILHTRGSEEGLDRYAAPMNNLLDRIALLLPQQLVQARDGHTLWWQHHCGHVMGVHDVRQPDEDECPACLPDERHGPWLPLLVAPDGAPAPERETPWCQHCGMLRAAPGHPFCPRCQYNFVPQEPMDALSERLHHEAVTSSTPSDVPVLIFRSASGRTEVARRDATAVLKGGFSINVLHGFDRLTSDEARRLGSKLAAKPLNDTPASAHEQPDLIAQVMAELGVDRPEDVQRAQYVLKMAQRHSAVALAHIEAERDEARAEAVRLDKLTAALTPTANKAQPDPLVLRLPEVPEGTVALVGVASLRRYILSGMHHAQWKVLGSTWIGGLTAVLTNEHPDGVRVELAPSREPRTWPRIKITAGADLPAVVDVEGHGRWTLDSQLYGKPGHPHLVLLTTLRGMGSVTEVLDEPDGGTA